MPSRSSTAESLNPWAVSGLAHAALALAVAALFFRPAARHEDVDISVIEAPKAAPQALSLSRPEPKKSLKQPRAVFGVSRKAVTDETSDVRSKAGNTVAKEQDQEKLRPEDADSLPVPTEEYLVTRMPELAEEVRVPYPPDARKQGVQGAVVMDILIDATGRVREARLVQGPHELLNGAALQAVRDFKFKPALMQDKPVAVRIRYAYRFVLEH